VADKLRQVKTSWPMTCYFTDFLRACQISRQCVFFDALFLELLRSFIFNTSNMCFFELHFIPLFLRYYV